MNTKLLWVLLLALSIGEAETKENEIAGKWAAESRTKGGLGAMLIFAGDGTVTSTFGAIVDFKYQVEGQTIKMTFPDSSNQVTEPYEIVGDKLIANPADPQKREERTRIGVSKPGAPPSDGLWTFKHYTGGMATMQYRTGGLGQLCVPMKTFQGRYKLQAQELTMDFEGQPTSNRKIQLSGDHLLLQATSTEPKQKFTRVSP
jgi:hypothetical protein